MLVTKSREVCRKCRLCMRSDAFLVFLFESSGALTNIAKAIKELLQYKVSKDDKYPPFVCCKCSDKLWEFKDFKEKCDYTKNSFEATLSSKSKLAAINNNTILGKTSKNHMQKYVPSTKQLSVKQEEELSESNVENYEVFMESIAAENTEKHSKTDHLEMSSKEPADLQVTNQGVEPLDCQETNNKKDKDSDCCVELVGNKTDSATQELEANDMEESDIQLLLSDSECEILEHCVVSVSKGQVMNKKRTSPHLTDSDSDCDVQILDTESELSELEVNRKEDLHSQQNVVDSESEVQILEIDTAAGAKGKDSFCRGNIQSPAKEMGTKKFIRQRTLTSYFVKHVTTPRKCGRREEDLTSVECSVKCLDQSNLKELNSCNSHNKTSSEYPDEGIRLILRPERNDNDREEIAHLSVNNGRMKWSFETIGKAVTENMMLHVKEYDKIGLQEIRAPEGDSINKSRNSVTGMGLEETSKDVCPALRERGKCQSGDKCSNSGQSHKSESFTYISQYKATDGHECNRCGKQFQNYEELKRHMSMDRTIHCQYCSLSFKNDSELFSHLPSHDGKVKWSCGDCGKKSVKWKDVWVHIQIHRKAHTCKQKLSITKQDCSLGNICKVCNKRMPNKRSLRMHLLSHSEESKWVCPHCEENFTEQGSLMHHIETHNSIMQSSNYHSIK